jgi:hypothetical protein
MENKKCSKPPTRYTLVGGIPTPLKNDGVKVSWDDDIPNMMGKIIQMFQTTNQYMIFRLMQHTATLRDATFLGLLPIEKKNDWGAPPCEIQS